MVPLLFYIICQIPAQIHRFPLERDLIQVQLGKEEKGLVQFGHAFCGFQDFLEIALLFFRRIGNPVLES